MRILGIIAEYNPFHNGHAWHIRQAKQLSGADKVIIVMSGCFVQRGTPALLSPAIRAQMALENGADAVFLLPAFWSVRDAEHFALGGVYLLDALGANVISFGCETEDISLHRHCAELLERSDPAFREQLQLQLASGLAYPAAMENALAAFAPDCAALLHSPNDTLAVCYLRAMLRLNSTMEVCPILREGSYHETDVTRRIASATAVRNAVFHGNWAAAESAMPSPAFSLLREEAFRHRVCSENSLDQLLTYRLRNMTNADYLTLPDTAEGIGDRLKKAALLHTGREQILDAVKTRRYPYARLSRMAAHALLGITQQQLDDSPLPDAAWLLGMKQDAAPLLRELHKHGFPMISKAADYTGKAAWFTTEVAAFDLWALACGLPAGLAFTQGVRKV